MTIPRYVVATAAEATRILHRLSRTGWHPRAGFGVPPIGSPIATHLVQRGTPFKVIADLLRHRSLNTTAIYAKVDLPALKRVALPWPGGQQP